ncbi:hypothetical protein HYZ99_04530 [Candidatus Peregrinibacteria bacterium]|nr:hypothetical protein [Candidatus Peregrinibacteria bacterium]
MPTFSPSYDNKIARRYSAGSLEQKVANKTALQKELGWPAEPKRPLLCLPAGMTDELGGDLLEEILPGLLTLPVELLILGKGPASYGALFTKLAKENRHRVAIIPAEEDAIRKMYAAADMALFFTDPKAMKELVHCLRYGVVPVAPASSVLENYDPIQESGTAFTYEKPTTWHCFTAIVRAMETHRFPFDWRTIQRYGMESVRD